MLMQPFRMQTWACHCPISQYTTDAYEITFRKDGGTVLHPETGHSFDFIKASNVYFIKMRVPKALVNPEMPNPRFGWQGKA